jgi:hypothetical protein
MPNIAVNLQPTNKQIEQLLANCFERTGSSLLRNKPLGLQRKTRSARCTQPDDLQYLPWLLAYPPLDLLFVLAACAKLIARTPAISPANMPAVRHCDVVPNVQITIAMAPAPSRIATIARMRSIDIV